jgi:ABC-type lipoprotein export system ATPase subunit
MLLSKGLTVITVTRDLCVAQRAGRVITLSDGVIVSDEENGRRVVKWMMGVDHENN